MAVTIRMMRKGTKNLPHSKIVVCDSRFPRDGRFLEELGVYNPALSTPLLKVNKERVEYWLSVGAKPSDAVRILFRKQGIYSPKAK